jgi:hypothetical protein
MNRVGGTRHAAAGGVAGRHARAGHWGARSAPVFGAGAVAYEIGANVDATCFGRIAAAHWVD